MQPLIPPTAPLSSKATARHEATLLILRSQAALAAVVLLARFIAQDQSSGMPGLPVAAITGWVLLFGPVFACLYCAGHGGVRRGIHSLQAVQWRWTLLRAALIVTGALCSFYAYAALALATAVTLSFLAPLFITILALLFLHEQVGWHRRGALLAGLLGLVCIVGPVELDTDQWRGSCAMVLAALCFATNTVIMKRQLRQETPAVNFLAVELCAALLAIPCFGPAMAAQLPDARQASALLLLATLSCFGVICSAEAHSRADASYLAPFTYLQLLWVTLAALLLWQEWPSLPTCFGAALIVVGGLYTARRERMLGISR